MGLETVFEIRSKTDVFSPITVSYFCRYSELAEWVRHTCSTVEEDVYDFTLPLVQKLKNYIMPVITALSFYSGQELLRWEEEGCPSEKAPTIEVKSNMFWPGTSTAATPVENIRKLDALLDTLEEILINSEDLYIAVVDSY